jgi:hypothetical protein
MGIFQIYKHLSLGGEVVGKANLVTLIYVIGHLATAALMDGI